MGQTRETLVLCVGDSEHQLNIMKSTPQPQVNARALGVFDQYLYLTSKTCTPRSIRGGRRRKRLFNALDGQPLQHAECEPFESALRCCALGSFLVLGVSSGSSPQQRTASGGGGGIFEKELERERDARRETAHAPTVTSGGRATGRDIDLQGADSPNYNPTKGPCVGPNRCNQRAWL